MNNNIGSKNPRRNRGDYSLAPNDANAIILDDETQRLLDATSSSNRNHEVIEEILGLVEKKAPKLLDGLATDNKIRIARLCQVKLYAHDDLVFRQGDEPDAYYTVIRGAVSIYASHSASTPSNAAPDEGSRDKFGIFITQVPPGESFGELSFNENGNHSRRNASVISDGSHGQARIRMKFESHHSHSTQTPHISELEASNVCVLLLVPEKVYMSEMFARHSEKHHTKEKMDSLRKSVLFKHWPMDQIIKVAYAMKKKQFEKGSTIIQQGERLEYLWIVREGVVRVSHRVPPPNDFRGRDVLFNSSGKFNRCKEQQGTSVEIAILGTNDVIGLIESLEPALRKSTREVVALCDTEMFFLPLSFFKRFLAKDSKTLSVVRKVVVRRKAWEGLRKDYATKFPNMDMVLPKKSFSISNYALDGCEEPSSSIISTKNAATDFLEEDYPSKALNSPGQYTGFYSNNIEPHRRNDNGRRKYDGLMKKNRESTLDLLAAEAGLNL